MKNKKALVITIVVALIILIVVIAIYNKRLKNEKAKTTAKVVADVPVPIDPVTGDPIGGGTEVIPVDETGTPIVATPQEQAAVSAVMASDMMSEMN